MKKLFALMSLSIILLCVTHNSTYASAPQKHIATATITQHTDAATTIGSTPIITFTAASTAQPTAYNLKHMGTQYMRIFIMMHVNDQIPMASTKRIQLPQRYLSPASKYFNTTQSACANCLSNTNGSWRKQLLIHQRMV